MYKFIAALCEQVLRIPHAPEPPPGDETTARSFRAAPNFYRYLIFVWGLKIVVASAGLIVWFAIAMPALIHVASKNGLEVWTYVLEFFEILGLIGTVGYWVYSWILVRLDFEKRWYLVTDRSLRVREGILIVREATVTFANIQNISISQGPVQRLLGIADLRVDTAGGGSVSHEQKGFHNLHTTFFRGVDNAYEIRELMQQRLRQLKDAGLGDHDDAERKPASPASVEFLDALRQVHSEAVRLREATQQHR